MLINQAKDKDVNGHNKDANDDEGEWEKDKVANDDVSETFFIAAATA